MLKSTSDAVVVAVTTAAEGAIAVSAQAEMRRHFESRAAVAAGRRLVSAVAVATVEIMAPTQTAVTPVAWVGGGVRWRHSQSRGGSPTSPPSCPRPSAARATAS